MPLQRIRFTGSSCGGGGGEAWPGRSKATCDSSTRCWKRTCMTSGIRTKCLYALSGRHGFCDGLGQDSKFRSWLRYRVQLEQHCGRFQQHQAFNCSGIELLGLWKASTCKASLAAATSIQQISTCTRTRTPSACFSKHGIPAQRSSANITLRFAIRLHYASGL